MKRMNSYLKKAVGSTAFLLLMLINMSVDSNALEKENLPDFAFPEKVEQASEAALKSALTGKDDVAALQSIIRIIAARNAVSADSFNRNIALIDSVKPMLKAPYSNLATLLEAGMYTQLYSLSPWQFNNRTLPLDDFPENPMEWSGDLFAKKVLELVDEAVADQNAARSTPIEKIQPLLTNFAYAEKTGLSVADFITIRAASLLGNFATSGSERIIPFFADAKPVAAGVREECGLRQTEIVDALYKWRETVGNIPALVSAIRLKSDYLPYEEREAFLGEWVKTLADDVACAPLLSEYMEYLPGDNSLRWPRKKQLYGLISDYLKRFPGSDYASLMKYDLAVLTEQRATLTLPDKSVSATKVKGTLTTENMNTVYVLLYSVPESIVPMNNLNIKEFPAKGKFIKAIKVEAEGTAPFTAEKEFELPALTPGYYVVVPSANPTLTSDWSKKLNRWSVNVLSVSDIAVITSMNRRERGSGSLFVVDASSQRPIGGATVKFYPDNSVKKVIKTLVTDKEGRIEVPEGFLRMRASYGNNVVWQSTDMYYDSKRSELTKRATVLTDLSVYKPGDNVGFSVVAWSVSGHDNKLLKSENLKVVLRDANWKEVDTLQLTTDAFGRCSGRFTLPESGLLGRYSISVTSSEGNDSFGTQSFQVAEYKAPTFFIALDSDSATSYEPGDTVCFKGEVKTYSGMSLGGQEVDFTVNWQQWWRWWIGGIDNASYSGKVTSDADGKFEIKLPTEALKGTPYERGIFTLTATSTSPSGETQSSSPLSFSLGKGFSINPDFGGEVREVTGETIRFNVPVYDILNHPVVKKVDYSVADAEGKNLFEGSFESPVLDLPTSRLTSGKYQFSFRLENDTVTTDRSITLWRRNDANPPVETPLWVPEKEVIVPTGASSVNVTVGSAYPGSWILYQVSDEDKIITRKWVAVNGDNVNIAIDTPTGNSRRWVSFIGMHDYVGKTAKVTLVPEETTKKMKVTTLSFRDKISAGDKEKWVFSFNVDEAVQGNIPAMAVMSNKALDAIYPFSWHLALGGNSWYDYSSIHFTQRNYRSVNGIFSVLPRYRQPDTSLPQWNTYNQLLAGGANGSLRIRGGGKMMMKSAMVGAVRNDAAPEPEEPMLMENEVLFATAATSDMAVVTEQKAEALEDGVAEADNGVVTFGASVEAKKEEPRPVELPLAFFMPNLTSDAEGKVNVEFTTPNFNTTWKFQIVGYNEAFKTAALTLEAVASKPVMVQTNPPRYLRTGDKASVSAVMFNNSPDPQMLHGEIVIFNPTTGETITSKHLGAEETAPGANRSFSIDFTVASDISALGIRAYAYAGDHTDGEQTIIPVLPSSTPVVESTQFYLGAGKDEFSVKLPKFRKDASLTLKYCTNPVWECVLALPELSKPDSKNVLSLSRALYADGMAKGIMTRFPSVKAGLEKVFVEKDGAGKATLTSNLEKDSLLKTVALVNTPWVNSAESETMRMRNLSGLLDSQKLQDAVNSLVEQIGAMQNPDGGWSWCEGMRSSDFITASVLTNIAALKSYGQGEGTDGMVNKAIAYCDKSLYDDYVKYDKKFSTITMLRYLYVRSALDKGDGKAGFKTLKNAAVKAIDSEWKNFSIYDKATAAILLNRTPGYEKTARLILESLRQLASKSETKGWWYDNLSGGWDAMPKLATTARALEAFAEIEPSTEAVDGLRQWLVLQKETENWGDNSASVGVIAAILNSGADWTDNTTAPEIRINGKPMEMASSEMLTGIMTMSLNPEEVSGKTLSIVRSGDGPAWGGVVSQYIAPVKEVKAEKCENLKIEKQLLLVTDSENGSKVEKVTKPLKTGDKVRVTLTLTCGKDMDYVAVIDELSACLEPIDQLSGYRNADGLPAYREVRDTKTSFFIGYLPKGVNVISYDCYVDREGEYALGIASAQSQYSPLQSAHSAGGVVIVK